MHTPPETDTHKPVVHQRAVPWIQFTCAVSVVAVFAIDRIYPGSPSSNIPMACLTAIALGVTPDLFKLGR